MKNFYFACKTFILVCVVCILCNGNTNSEILLKTQDKSLMNQSSIVYQPGEVDIKAVLDTRKSQLVSGQGCEKSEGKVALKVVLHVSGKVTDVEVVESGSCEIFLKRAIKAVKKRKFTPAKKNGVFVSQYQKLEYHYSIQ